jgi:hypothetical protein
VFGVEGSRQTTVTRVALVALSVLAGPLAGCGSDNDAVDVADTSSTVPGREAFCAVATALPEEVPRSAIGSAEHVAILSELLAVAPDELRDALVTLRDYTQAEVSPDDPESQTFERMPPEVQSSAVQVQEYADGC